MCVCVHACLYRFTHMSVSAHEGEKRAFDPVEQESQVAESPLVEVLRTALLSSAKGARALNH